MPGPRQSYATFADVATSSDSDDEEATSELFDKGENNCRPYREEDVNVFLDKVVAGSGSRDQNVNRICKQLKRACEKRDFVQIVRVTLHLVELYQDEKRSFSREKKTMRGKRPRPAQERRRRRHDHGQGHGSSRNSPGGSKGAGTSERSPGGKDKNDAGESTNSSKGASRPQKVDENADTEEEETNNVKDNAEEERTKEPSSSRRRQKRKANVPENRNKIPEEDSSKKSTKKRRIRKPKRKVLVNKCDFCGKICTSYSALESHVRVHTHERPFSCTFSSQCRVTLRTKGGLDRHILVKHLGAKQFKCFYPKCNKAFLLKKNLTVHTRAHVTPFRCNYSGCSKAYSQKTCLDDHKRNAHSLPV